MDLLSNILIQGDLSACISNFINLEAFYSQSQNTSHEKLSTILFSLQNKLATLYASLARQNSMDLQTRKARCSPSARTKIAVNLASTQGLQSFPFQEVPGGKPNKVQAITSEQFPFSSRRTGIIFFLWGDEGELLNLM